jgi:hypothetical protein
MTACVTGQLRVRVCGCVAALLLGCAGDLRDEVTHEVMAAAQKLQEQHAQDVPGFTAPAAVIACSAVTGEANSRLRRGDLLQTALHLCYLSA